MDTEAIPLGDDDTLDSDAETPLQVGEKRITRGKAIQLHCKDCIYDEIGGVGNWRQQVSACTVTKCALYPFRPVSKPHNVKERTNA